MDEDARQHEELREQYNLQERRLSLLQTELEEVRSALEGSERSRKMLEQEVVDITERHNEVNIQVGWWLPQKCHGNSYSGCQGKSRLVPRPVSSPQNSEVANVLIPQVLETHQNFVVVVVMVKNNNNTKCTILAMFYAQHSVLTTCTLLCTAFKYRLPWRF